MFHYVGENNKKYIKDSRQTGKNYESKNNESFITSGFLQTCVRRIK
jgi:hypothetical protein